MLSAAKPAAAGCLLLKQRMALPVLAPGAHLNAGGPSLRETPRGLVFT